MSYHNSNVAYKVEKNIKMPPVGYRGLYPLNKMKVGDSFFVPCVHQTQARVRCSIIAAGKSFVKAHNEDFKMTTRMVERGIRAWRIK